MPSALCEAGAQRLHGINLSAEDLATLLATGGDDEVRDLIAAGRVAEAIGVARFNQAEAAFNWDKPHNRQPPVGAG